MGFSSFYSGSENWVRERSYIIQTTYREEGGVSQMLMFADMEGRLLIICKDY